MTSDDPVNHPRHYINHPSGIECIDVVEHMNFNRGNAMKYIWRAGDKGNEIQDLEKAAWYINREVARLKKEQSEKLSERVLKGLLPWVEWNGGPCPVHPETTVEYLVRNGNLTIRRAKADHLGWLHSKNHDDMSDITYYRVLK